MKLLFPLICFCLFFITPAKAQFTVASTPVLCFGGCDGSLQISPATGYRYLWNTGDTTPSLHNLCSASYQCIISNLQGTALDTLIAVVAHPNPISINLIAFPVSCTGAKDGRIVVQEVGGVAPYSAEATKNFSDFAFSANDTFAGLDSGKYVILVSDNNGCNISDTISVPTSSSECTDIKDIPQLKNFSIQPNPANDFTRVVYELNETEPFKISILDITGKKVQQVLNDITAKGRHSITINLTTLPAGEYILNVVSGSGSFNAPLIKQ